MSRPKTDPAGQEHATVFALHGGRARGTGLPAMSAGKSAKAVMNCGSIMIPRRTEQLWFGFWKTVWKTQRLMLWCSKSRVGAMNLYPTCWRFIKRKFPLHPNCILPRIHSGRHRLSYEWRFFVDSIMNHQERMVYAETPQTDDCPFSVGYSSTRFCQRGRCWWRGCDLALPNKHEQILVWISVVPEEQSPC